MTGQNWNVRADVQRATLIQLEVSRVLRAEDKLTTKTRPSGTCPSHAGALPGAARLRTRQLPAVTWQREGIPPHRGRAARPEARRPGRGLRWAPDRLGGREGEKKVFLLLAAARRKVTEARKARGREEQPAPQPPRPPPPAAAPREGRPRARAARRGPRGAPHPAEPCGTPSPPPRPQTSARRIPPRPRTPRAHSSALPLALTSHGAALLGAGERPPALPGPQRQAAGGEGAQGRGKALGPRALISS